MGCLPFLCSGRRPSTAAVQFDHAPEVEGAASNTRPGSRDTARTRSTLLQRPLPRPGLSHPSSSPRSIDSRPSLADTVVPAPAPSPLLSFSDRKRMDIAECLQAWHDAASPYERPQRQAAATAITDAIRLRSPGLELTGLTALPDCMHHMPSLHSLMLRHCRMNQLPELPPTLAAFEADELQLTSLPRLPAGLFKLVLRDSHLTALPKLPAGLKHVDVRNNRLTTLVPPGSALPAILKHLDVSNNALETLPTLPSGLDQLFVQHNRLTHLPALPPQLGWLFASHNALIDMPPVPASLRMLHLDHNALEDLPDSIADIMMSYTIDVEHNPLPPTVLARIDTLLRLRTGQPLTMRLNLPADDRERRRPHVLLATGEMQRGTPLAAAALRWYARARIGRAEFQNRQARWQAIDGEHALRAGPTERNAADPEGTLQDFLGRLARTEEYRQPATRDAFTRRVTALLDAMVDDPDLLAKATAIATEAISDCVDRIATSLDQIDVARMTCAVRRGTTTRAELIDTATRLFKVAALDRHAVDWMHAHLANESDEVEVQLAFRTALADRLQLPLQTRATRYAGGVRLTDDALDAACKAVRTAAEDPARMSEFVADWAPWAAHLEAGDGEWLRPTREDLDVAKAGLQQRLEGAVQQLQAALETTGDMSTPFFDARVAIAKLEKEFRGLERLTMRPVLITRSRAILETMGWS